jgi:hypothetical protein
MGDVVMTDEELAEIPDILRQGKGLPDSWVRRLLARLDVAEAVCRAAQDVSHLQCENFGEGSKYNCYQEPEQGWAVELLPCLYCALMSWLKACGP